ncbi:MAG: recombination-associated protein RdgC [Thermodesulfobacteriota bacterium]|nr:recombination-associated protein RdgC [Thermodesulfobacteriota bacterium]
MGLLSGSVSFVRYAIEGDPPQNFWDFTAEQVAKFSFKDIDDSYEERSVGWVSTFNMFDSEFTEAAYSAGDYIVLSLRIDERKVSLAALKKFCLKEEERIKKERRVPRLNKAVRQEIKENVRLMLVKKAVPIPSVYDLCWNFSKGTLLFFSTGRKAQEVLENFFKETFGLRIVLQIPYLAAAHLLDDQNRKTLSDIGPSIFV